MSFDNDKRGYIYKLPHLNKPDCRVESAVYSTYFNYECYFGEYDVLSIVPNTAFVNSRILFIYIHYIQ